MKPAYSYVWMIIAAAVTIFGLITGKYLFLLFMFPISFGFFRRKKNDDDDDA